MPVAPPEAPRPKSANQAAADGPSCEIRVYDRAGCGAREPARVCSRIPPPAAGIYCGCDGKTFMSFRGVSQSPFAHVGDCEGDVAAPR